MGFYLKRLHKKYILNELDYNDIVVAFPGKVLSPIIWVNDFLKAPTNKRSKHIGFGLLCVMIDTLLVIGAWILLNDKVLSPSTYNNNSLFSKIGLIILVPIVLWSFISDFNGLRWMIRMYNSPIKSKTKTKTK